MTIIIGALQASWFEQNRFRYANHLYTKPNQTKQEQHYLVLTDIESYLTFVLATLNSDRLVSISIVDTFNIPTGQRQMKVHKMSWLLISCSVSAKDTLIA